MALDDSVRNMQLEALSLPKKPIALDKPNDYAKNGGRASCLPIRDLPLYQRAWSIVGAHIYVETKLCDDSLYAILHEEMMSQDLQQDMQFIRREVRVAIPDSGDCDDFEVAAQQLADKLYAAYRVEYGAELQLKRPETEGLIITDLLFLNKLRENFGKD